MSDQLEALNLLIESAEENQESAELRNSAVYLVRDHVRTLEARIAELEQANRWLSVSEGLPKIADGEERITIEVFSKRLNEFAIVDYWDDPRSDDDWLHDTSHWRYIQPPENE